MSYQGLSVFQRKRMAECLTAQAHLRERAASLCWNEETAIELEVLRASAMMLPPANGPMVRLYPRRGRQANTVPIRKLRQQKI